MSDLSESAKQEFSYIYDIGNRLHIYLQSYKRDDPMDKLAPKVHEVLGKLFEQVFVLDHGRLGQSFSINEGNGPWNMTMATSRSEIIKEEFIYFASEINPGKFARFIYQKGNWRENHDI